MIEGVKSSYFCLVTQSCLTLCNAMDCSLPNFSVHGDFPGKNTGVDHHFLLQEDLPDQGIEFSSPPSLCIAGGFFTAEPSPAW